jgi:hypothetical protein
MRHFCQLPLAACVLLCTLSCTSEGETPDGQSYAPSPTRQDQGKARSRQDTGSRLDERRTEEDWVARYRIEPPEDQRYIDFLDLRAERPASWTWSPPRSTLRLLNYAVPAHDGGESADFAVFRFQENSGNTVDANVSRWRGQFRSDDGGPVRPILSTRTIAGLPATVVEIHGEYMGMGAGWHRADHLFLAVILEHPDGNLFMRLLGPASTVESHRGAWTRILEELTAR